MRQSRHWKRVLTVSARLSVLTLFIVGMWALAACDSMPEAEPAVEEDTVTETTPATTEDEVAESDHAEEPMAGEMESDSEEEVAAEAPEEEVATETTEEEVASPVVEDWTQHFVAEGQYVYLGNPEAAVTILDVSDFL